MGCVSDLAQISIKKCARFASDSALESSSAAKFVSMQLCVSSIVIDAFSKEEGKVTTEDYYFDWVKGTLKSRMVRDASLLRIMIMPSGARSSIVLRSLIDCVHDTE